MRARHVDLLTVAGAQEMHSFWERIIQPQLFALLSVRYGGTEHVSHAKRPTDAIANGQFILVRRGSVRRDGRSRARARPCRRGPGAGARVGARRAAHRARCIGDATSSRRTCIPSLSGSRVAAGARTSTPAVVTRRSAAGSGARCIRSFCRCMPISALVPPIVLLLCAAGILSGAWLVWSAIVYVASVGYLGVAVLVVRPAVVVRAALSARLSRTADHRGRRGASRAQSGVEGARVRRALTPQSN